MYEYENIRRVFYPDRSDEIGDAVFVPVCEKCHKFVKADEKITLDWKGLKDQPNATCSKCGRTKMLFEGFI